VELGEAVISYYLRLRSPRVIGSIALQVSTLNAAKALAREWLGELEASRRNHWKVEITNERGESLWTL
jgi:hypothetical protein